MDSVLYAQRYPEQRGQLLATLSPLCLLASLKRSGLYSINVKEQEGLLIW